MTLENHCASCKFLEEHTGVYHCTHKENDTMIYEEGEECWFCCDYFVPRTDEPDNMENQ